jgi:hypothetical protein
MREAPFSQNSIHITLQGKKLFYLCFTELLLSQYFVKDVIVRIQGKPMAWRVKIVSCNKINHSNSPIPGSSIDMEYVEFIYQNTIKN